jgi:hypothetical protein
MSLTLLQIIQAASLELFGKQPLLVVGSTDQGTVQLLALANSLGRELQRGFDWQKLCTEYRFNTQYLTVTGDTQANSAVITNLSATTGLDSTYSVLGIGINQDTTVLTKDSATQVTLNQPATITGTGVSLSFCKTKYTYPADYDRPIDQTQWDKTRHWELLGPQTPQEWQWLKSGYISTGPRMKFRPLGGYFQTWPLMASAEYLGFEYVSNGWARSSAGAAQSSFLTDTDTCVFPDDLMIVGLKDKFTLAKGLARVYQADFEQSKNLAWANDSGSDRLSLAPRPISYLLTANNLPDSGYGS